MNTVVIACRTIRDELDAAMQKAGAAFPIEWIESGLHDTPNKLTARLMEILDAIPAGRALLAMGFCGNAILGISAKAAELIVPRVDDCLSLLLGSMQARAKISAEHAAYFLTEGWMRGERNIWVDYQYTLKKYGEDVAKDIAQEMFGHYRTLALLDAGVVPIGPLISSTEIIANTLHLEQKIFPATLRYIEQLLSGPWPDAQFIVKAAGKAITAADLCLTTQ